MDRLNIQNFINNMNFQPPKNYPVEEQLVSDRLQRHRGGLTPPSTSSYKPHNYSSRVPSKTPPLMYPPFLGLGHPHEPQFGQAHHLGQMEQKGSSSASSSFHNGLPINSYDLPVNASSSKRPPSQGSSSHEDSSDMTPGGSVKNRGRPRGSKSIKTNAHREKTFECSTCSKAFYTGQNLQQHERIHAGVYPYSCTQCESSFVQRTQLNQHLRSAHHMPMPNDGQIREPIRNRPFRCQMCPKSFIQKSRLDKHVTKSHPPPVS